MTGDQLPYVLVRRDTLEALVSHFPPDLMDVAEFDTRTAVRSGRDALDAVSELTHGIDCATCQRALHSAEVHAKATGSVGCTYSYGADHTARWFRSEEHRAVSDAAKGRVAQGG